MISCNKYCKLTGSIALAAILSACGSGGSDDGSIANNGGPTDTNRAPSISGNPPSTVIAGQAFSFAPSASDPDGDNLSFSIQNKPDWVTTFNESTGAMSGTPGSNDVGVYQQIVVTVTDGALSSSLSPFSVEVDTSGTPPPPTNRAPSIGGNPADTVIAGNTYSFTPTASDQDGDNLTFSIQNRPSWISFNSNTGRISGTPGVGDVGQYNQIIISVSDGQESDALTAFSIDVTQVTSGSVTLDWEAPTQNTDGSPLTDLAGYAFYYGTRSGNYPNRVQLDDSSLTRYVVENLSANTYYFVAVSIKSNGVESAYSNEAVKPVQ